jgi:hypothetical protein
MDPEEDRLLIILADCRVRLGALTRALTSPDHLVLGPEYKTLVEDCAAATAEFEKAITALREYRRSRDV